MTLSTEVRRHRGFEGTDAGAEILDSAWKLIRKDPGKGLTLAYLWLTAVGFARLFGTGIGFGINAIDLASPTDFLVAGLRDPFAVILACLSGWGLVAIWRRSLTNVRWKRLLAPGAVALLFVALLASCWYRQSVVKGGRLSNLMGPLPMTVTLDSKEPAVSALSDVKLVLSTVGFIVFYRPSDQAVLVIKRDAINRMELRLPN
jgi:hypothetical protein